MRRVSTWVCITEDGVPEPPEESNPPFLGEGRAADFRPAMAVAAGFLLGRVVVDLIDSTHKYVDSTTSEGVEGSNWTLIDGEAEAEVAKLEGKPGSDLVVSAGQHSAGYRAGERLHLDARTFRLARPQREPTGARVSGLVQPLTERELEVLRLLAAGRRNREIAQKLVISLDTVKKHISHIHAKLGATSRTEAAAYARWLGLID
jgi:DNA-binding NarL/FixJ family response regulator